MGWQLWTAGEISREVRGISPLVAVWGKTIDPAMIRLRSFVESIATALLPLPESGQLFVHLDVDVGDPKRLMHHYDLENYLTPLFGSCGLPARRFSLVSARKFVGGGSRIVLGVAMPKPSFDEPGWEHLSIDAGQGYDDPAWKARIHSTLVDARPTLIPPGPAKVRVAWKCSSNRNWSRLWKPTGDAMGPVLGAADPARPHHLDDDRIVDIEFHHCVDNCVGHNVTVGMWWRTA